MAEETGESVEQVETQVTTEEQVESQEIDYKAEYEKLSQLTEKQKSEIQGLDKKVGELSEAQKELLKQTETAEQTAAREKEEAQEKLRLKEDDLTTREAKAIERETKLDIKLKALDLGVDLNDIEELGIKSVEGVEKYKALLDKKLESKAEKTKENIQKELSNENRQTYNSNKSGVSYPSAIEKAFS